MERMRLLLLTVTALAVATGTVLAAVYSYKCPKCGLIQQYAQPGIYKCPNDGWIMRTDPEGNVLSSRAIGEFDDMGFDTIVEARPTAGGRGFLVLGSSDTIAEGGSQMWLGRFDGEGRARWLRQVGGAHGDLAGDGHGLDFAGALVPLKGGKTAFGGISWDPDHEDQATIGKIGRRGDVLMQDCDWVGDLPESYFDLMDLTISFDSRATATDSDATASDGNLLLDRNSPISSDEMVCYD